MQSQKQIWAGMQNIILHMQRKLQRCHEVIAIFLQYPIHYLHMHVLYYLQNHLHIA